MLRHTIYRGTKTVKTVGGKLVEVVRQQIAKEYAVCQNCHEQLEAGERLDVLLATTQLEQRREVGLSNVVEATRPAVKPVRASTKIIERMRLGQSTV